MPQLPRPSSHEPEHLASAISLSFDQIEKLLPKAMGVATLNWPGGQYFSNVVTITHGQPHQVRGGIAVPINGGVNISEYICIGIPGPTQQQYNFQGFEVTHTNQDATTTGIFYVLFGSL